MKLDARIDLHLKRTALFLGYMLIAVGLIWAASKMWVFLSWLFDILSPFIIALIVAYIFNPIVNAVENKLHLGRIGGIIVVGLIMVLIVCLLIGIMIPVLYAQISDMVLYIRDNWPAFQDRIFQRLGVRNPEALQERITQWFQGLNIDLQKAGEKLFSAMPQITSGGASAMGSVARGLGTVLGGVIGFFITISLVTVIAFYSLLEFGGIPRLIRMVLPAEYEERTMDILSKLDEAIGGFLRGQLIAATIVGVLSVIGMASIGMWKYALLIGVIAGIGNFIPYLGPVMGATPAALWALFTPAHETWSERFLYVGLVIGIFSIIQMVDGYFSQPKIVGKNSNLHPLIVIAALIIGAQFGLSGMIVAVPVAAGAKVLFLELYWKGHVVRKQAAQITMEKSGSENAGA